MSLFETCVHKRSFKTQSKRGAEITMDPDYETKQKIERLNSNRDRLIDFLENKLCDNPELLHDTVTTVKNWIWVPPHDATLMRWTIWKGIMEHTEIRVVMNMVMEAIIQEEDRKKKMAVDAARRSIWDLSSWEVACYAVIIVVVGVVVIGLLKALS